MTSPWKIRLSFKSKDEEDRDNDTTRLNPNNLSVPKTKSFNSTNPNRDLATSPSSSSDMPKVHHSPTFKYEVAGVHKTLSRELEDITNRAKDKKQNFMIYRLQNQRLKNPFNRKEPSYIDLSPSKPPAATDTLTESANNNKKYAREKPTRNVRDVSTDQSSIASEMSDNEEPDDESNVASDSLSDTESETTGGQESAEELRSEEVKVFEINEPTLLHVKVEKDEKGNRRSRGSYCEDSVGSKFFCMKKGKDKRCRSHSKPKCRARDPCEERLKPECKRCKDEVEEEVWIQNKQKKCPKSKEEKQRAKQEKKERKKELKEKKSMECPIPELEVYNRHKCKPRKIKKKNRCQPVKCHQSRRHKRREDPSEEAIVVDERCKEDRRHKRREYPSEEAIVVDERYKEDRRHKRREHPSEEAIVVEERYKEERSKEERSKEERVKEERSKEERSKEDRSKEDRVKEERPKEKRVKERRSSKEPREYETQSKRVSIEYESKYDYEDQNKALSWYVMQQNCSCGANDLIAELERRLIRLEKQRLRNERYSQILDPLLNCNCVQNLDDFYTRLSALEAPRVIAKKEPCQCVENLKELLEKLQQMETSDYLLRYEGEGNEDVPAIDDENADKKDCDKLYCLDVIIQQLKQQLQQLQDLGESDTQCFCSKCGNQEEPVVYHAQLGEVATKQVIKKEDLARLSRIHRSTSIGRGEKVAENLVFNHSRM